MKYMRMICLMAAALLLFCLALNRLDSDRQLRERQQLADAVRRAALACYAAEGFYPPDVAYLRANYGLRYDEDRYRVVYDVFASNLMPDITVLEK